MNRKKIQLCENIMNKYNNYKKNDNIIVKAGNITLVGAGVGLGIRVDTTDHLKGCKPVVYVYICIYRPKVA